MRVYKAGISSIITLELLPDSKTNEARNGVYDLNFAKFRTNKAKVISIVDPKTTENRKWDYSEYDRCFKYNVDQIVEVADYDNNINEICAPGIHYFKTREAAVSYYWASVISVPDGTYTFYHDNGRVKLVKSIKSGFREGKYEIWYINGQKSVECTYLSGEIHGKYTSWYENGDIEVDHVCAHGEIIEPGYRLFNLHQQ